MDLRDTKILIPEIPGEWTQRTRSGNTNVWNDPWHKTGLPEVRMEPPQKGLYALDANEAIVDASSPLQMRRAMLVMRESILRNQRALAA